MSLFRLTVFLTVQIVVTEKEDASYYANRQSIPSLIPQSIPFPSLNCGHFCTTRPAVTCLTKNGQKVDTCPNLDFDPGDLGDLSS